MKKLLLMRHAKSSWKDHKLDDFDRPLAKRGYSDTLRMGAWLQGNWHIPDLILSSSALRAHETACGLLFALQSPGTVLQENRKLYLSDTRSYLEILDLNAEAGDTILLIGHNPTLDELLEYLSKDSLPYTGDGKLMTTASIAVLQPTEKNGKLGKASCKLIDLQRPGSLQ